MRPELVDALRQGARLSKGSAHMLRYGLVDASRSGCDEMTEHLGLHWIRGGRVFWVPLNAEIPACMIL